MKRIHLLRHAKSSWEDPSLPDHDRPLAPRGRRAAEALARHLRSEAVAPEAVLCSSARRARQTLEPLMEVLGGAEVLVEDALYAAEAEELLERLRRVPDRVESVMIVAHNPGLQDLAIELVSWGPDLGRVREKFPTGGLATIGFAGAWRELAPGRGTLVSFVTPRDLS
jgi:phosphohistidine phosphatase